MVTFMLTSEEVKKQIEDLVHNNGMYIVMILQSDEDYDAHICSGVDTDAIKHLVKDCNDFLDERVLRLATPLELLKIANRDKES